jgi:hypothetical protein
VQYDSFKNVLEIQTQKKAVKYFNILNSLILFQAGLVIWFAILPYSLLNIHRLYLKKGRYYRAMGGEIILIMMFNTAGCKNL